MSKPLVMIYADESCLGVQFTDRDSPGGAAGLVETWHNDAWVRRDYWVSEPATTNNRMAIRSAIEGLRGLSKPCGIRFVSDSQYLVRAMSEWLSGWKRAGWKRRAGPLENADLWRTLAEATNGHDISWEWIRGHAGHPQNEYANYLAIRAAKKQDASQGFVDSGFVSWLENQREKHNKYFDFNEWAAPL